MPGRRSIVEIATFGTAVDVVLNGANNVDLVTGTATVDSAAERCLMIGFIPWFTVGAGFNGVVEVLFNGVVLQATVSGASTDQPVTVMSPFTPGEVTAGINGQVPIKMRARLGGAGTGTARGGFGSGMTLQLLGLGL